MVCPFMNDPEKPDKDVVYSRNLGNVGLVYRNQVRQKSKHAKKLFFKQNNFNIFAKQTNEKFGIKNLIFSKEDVMGCFDNFAKNIGWDQSKKYTRINLTKTKDNFLD